MLMGSNYPWSPREAFTRQQEELGAFEELNGRKMRGVERDNSLALFPRLACG
jgi:hypothetical protein